ncbi:MAG: hypothetical protein HY914_17690 [Desulfomonile tiedjei]|nr:hypothetical protein [Desulfomonile tiedjei]
MIVRCCYCEGVLRVDETSLPAGRRAKIRCPHCKKIGSMPDIPLQGAVSEDATAEAPAEPRDHPRLLPMEESSPAVAEEATMPRDAFQSFRFPAEQEESREHPKTSRHRGLRLAVWVIVSLAIVSLFALLVNLILPGPAGVQQTVHTAPGESVTPPQKPPATTTSPGAR